MYSGNEILDFSASGIPQFPSRLIAKRKETATVLCGGGGMAKRNIRQGGWQGGFLYVYIYIQMRACVSPLPPHPVIGLSRLLHTL